jgi:COMPASS component SPP1
MTLATHRIYRVLPNRIQEFQLTESSATILNEKALDEIRQKIAVVRATLAELDKRHKELDLLLEQAKRCELDPKAMDSNDVEDEMSMYCITCGHEIHSRTAMRHLEKCFNKYESQASFGSIFKTRIEGGNSMFCDFFNPASNTYCKRLRVLCPEHCKDPKVNETDICGCPLTRNVFQLTGEFCRAPKKSCFKHYSWEKIRRAEIDLERVRQWLKMDELIEQERQIRLAMSSRAGVLGLMLHSTYDHELIPKLVGQSQQQTPQPAQAQQRN